MKITAGILTGGSSLRMGRDKALLSYQGRTFLDRVADAAAAFDELLVSVREKDAYPGLPYAMVEDELRDFGPVEGIYQLLRAAKNPYVLAVAADMQRLTAAFLQDFTACLQPEDQCLVLCSGTLLEPLCSVYGKDALPLLAQMRETSVRRPRALFPSLRTRYVDVAALGYDLRVVENINTEEDYAALLREEQM